MGVLKGFFKKDGWRYIPGMFFLIINTALDVVPAELLGQAVDLMFRPSGVFRKASCVVECNGREIARKKAPIFTPGEMAVVTLKPETVAALDGDVTVRIERSEA